jgi:hypothetical protein
MTLGQPHQQEVRCDMRDSSTNSVWILPRKAIFSPINLSINYGSWRWAASVIVEARDGR